MAEQPDNLTDRFDELCSVGWKIAHDIQVRTGVDNVDALLRTAWKEAFDTNAYRSRGKGVTFFTPIPGAEDAQSWLEVTMRPSDPQKSRDGKPYYLYGIDVMAGRPRAYATLRDFAFVPAFEEQGKRNLYRELAAMALPEPWSFISKDRTEILERYLDSTFLRVLDEDKIVYARDREGAFAVFCTGLVSKRFEDIFCLCVPNDGYAQPWRVDSFFTSGSSHAGKRLRGACGSKLPQRADYVPRKEDALYNSSLPLVPDYQHLLLRLGRISIPTIKVLLASMPEALDAIRRAEGIEDWRQREECLAHDLAALTLPDELERTISLRLKYACEVAAARARYMYSSALPAWSCKNYQGGDSFFCLPLCLLDDNIVDTVLVAKLQDGIEEPYYEGATLYSLRMAYRYTRAIQRADGLTGWIGSAFEPKTPGAALQSEATLQSGAAPQSDFASTIAPDLTPPPVPTPVQEAGLAGKTEALSLILVPDSPTPSFAVKIFGGYEIGIVRRGSEKLPEAVLPTGTPELLKAFYNVSQHHGRFCVKDGSWHYEQLGAWPTDIRYADGSRARLGKPGETAPIAPGDKMVFAGSMPLKVTART